MRRFEFHGNGSERFWEVERDGATVTVRFGRIGTNGQTKVKDLDDEAAAEAHLEDLIAAKVKKGYLGVDGDDAPTVAAADAPDAVATSDAAAAAPAPATTYVDIDEDSLAVPKAWRRRVHPIRGIDPVDRVVPDPKAADRMAALLEGTEDRVREVIEHEDSDPEVAEAARRYLAGGDDPLGAAVVAYLVSIHLRPRDLSQMAAMTDDWVERHGPAWAAEAGTRIGELGRRAIYYVGERSRTAIVRAEPGGSSVYLDSFWPLLARLRRLLATVDDATHAEVLARLAPLRSGSGVVRAIGTYLTPSEVDLLDRDLQDLASLGTGKHGPNSIYAFNVTEVAQAKIVLDHVSAWAFGSDLDQVISLVVHVGPGVAPLLATQLDELAGKVGEAKLRKALIGCLAQLPSDDVFDALLDRFDQKYVGPALVEAQDRFPRRAGRLLAAAAAEGSGARAQAAAESLRGHLAAHPGLADRLLPELDPPAAAVVSELVGADAAVVRATAEQVPDLLAVPPWTTRPKATKAVVIDTVPPPPPATLAWAPGEREAWLAIDLTRRFTGRTTTSWPEYLADVRAGSRPHLAATVLATAPPEEVAGVIDELLAASEALPQIDRLYSPDVLRRLLANVGDPIVDWVQEQIRDRPAQREELLLPMEGGDVAVTVAEWLHRSRARRPLADAWLARHPAAAARDLLAPALAKPGPTRSAAEAALRHLAAEGHGDTIRAQATAAGPEVAEAIDAVLATDPLHLLPTRIPPLPAWLEPAGLPPVLVADQSVALPPEAVTVLLTMLALSKPGEPYAGLAAVRPDLDPSSLAELGWAAFERWRAAGMPTKQAWLLDGLALVGDDETVRRLDPVIRAWPGESAHARAVTGIDVLAAIGTDVALLHLHRISEKVKFKGLKAKAQEKITEVADELGLSTEQLADRLVPDFGLDADGSLVLDYGPRSFRVGFDEQLKPVVFDADGTRRTTLPKPGAKDDAVVAGPASKRFASLKKEVRAIATDQIRRFEQAMVAQRRWPAAELRTFFVDHPLLWHLSRRLVWATFDEHGALTGSFRVAEDRTLADAQDREVQLGDDATVGVAHPLHLGEAVGSWSTVFADYEILQPFPQLGREVLALTDEERSATVLTRLDGVTVATGKVLGLAHRGWERGAVEDGGIWTVTVKAVPGLRYAVLDLDPGVIAGAATEFAEQTLSRVWLSPSFPGWGSTPGDESFGELDPITASELLRDLDHLRG